MSDHTDLVFLWIPNPMNLEGSKQIPMDLSVALNNEGLFPGQLFFLTAVTPADFKLNSGVPLCIDVPNGYGFDHLRFMQKDPDAAQPEHNLTSNILRIPVNMLSPAGSYPAEILARYFKEQWQFHSNR